MNTIVLKSLLALSYLLAYAVFALLIIRPDVTSYWYPRRTDLSLCQTTYDFGIVYSSNFPIGLSCAQGNS